MPEIDLSTKTGKILASTVGAAAAAGVAGVALAALRKKDPAHSTDSDAVTVFHVKPDTSGSGWAVATESSDQPQGRYDTKREAVGQARDLVRQAQPSRLVIHGADGKVQRHHSYGTDAA